MWYQVYQTEYILYLSILSCRMTILVDSNHRLYIYFFLSCVKNQFIFFLLSRNRLIVLYFISVHILDILIKKLWCACVLLSNDILHIYILCLLKKKERISYLFVCFLLLMFVFFFFFLYFVFLLAIIMYICVRVRIG